MSSRAGALRAALLERPWHVLTAGFVIGLAAGPRAPLAMALAALALCGLTAPPGWTLAALALLFGGAGLADARLAVLDRPPPPAAFGHAATSTATLLETPREEAHGGLRAAIELDRRRVLLRWRGAAPALVTGDVVVVRGALARPSPRDAWLASRHIHAILRADDVAATGARRGGVAGLIDAVRRRALVALGHDLPPAQAGLLRGMVLGDDATLPPATRQELRRAGLGHLVAASGANIALLAALAMGIGAALGTPLRSRLLLVLGLIALYVPLAGGGASIRRAGVMGGAAVAATLASRPAARWHALLLAAAVTLALDPASLTDPGWQLSFAAVVAIALLAAPIRDALRARRIPWALAEAIAVTAAATIGTAPVSAARFGTLSLISLPANIIVAPVVAPITWIGMLAALAAQVAEPLAWPFVWLAAAPVAFVTWAGHVAAGLPGAAVSAPAVLVGLVTCAIAAAVRWPAARRAGRPLALAGCLAALVAGAARLAAGPQPGITATSAGMAFLDIGQGDATLLFDHGRTILVDTGPPDGPVLRRLHDLGVRRLDALLVTHAQADHDGAGGAILRALPVGALLDGRDGVREPAGAALDSAGDAHLQRLIPRAGSIVRAGALSLHVLSPGPGGTAPGEDPNVRAVVAVGQVGGVRILLTSDAESDVLAPLHPPPVDVLKVSHHGSADPGLGDLLSELRPRLAVIEVGAHNTYGHPTPATLATLDAAAVPVLRTDRDGTVVVTVDGGTLRVHRHA